MCKSKPLLDNHLKWSDAQPDNQMWPACMWPAFKFQMLKTLPAFIACHLKMKVLKSVCLFYRFYVCLEIKSHKSKTHESLEAVKRSLLLTFLFKCEFLLISWRHLSQASKTLQVHRAHRHDLFPCCSLMLRSQPWSCRGLSVTAHTQVSALGASLTVQTVKHTDDMLEDQGLSQQLSTFIFYYIMG